MSGSLLKGDLWWLCFRGASLRSPPISLFTSGRPRLRQLTHTPVALVAGACQQCDLSPPLSPRRCQLSTPSSTRFSCLEFSNILSLCQCYFARRLRCLSISQLLLMTPPLLLSFMNLLNLKITSLADPHLSLQSLSKHLTGVANANVDLTTV